ncbi:hypothetical protein AMES_2110 [Amycolatopsis mediterranei S699]|uniref:SCP1.201-like deaminase n=2 Tax=Amycolatopsis mediterranei TaxID=33910 RepID=A0A0H3D002_AMYMU|nr:DddA-like double-stranded DNA deaminase toxin [Amycolatopsis mediterranei]ADJ43933.1 hypothetical protein AMED_2128 [Amycolatopsis mediterranei U32]AEK40655.1 hypothetical protein RAM_10825 [Amycolatopsis mediterranei S699]AFO75646.1 hypothetical protein AMES_2110 [Amycolatopsis mediterranei S699]AGT82775.1 hypothetical protein B737_2111 [Amycolatopsis mediterranei RB]KDO04271.1 hypothetical protein DV26_44805 [Amycolatopsis mediterranei]
MAGVEDLAAAVRTALGKLSPASLEQAAGCLDEAVQALTQTGSQQPEMQQAISGLMSVAEGVTSVQQLVARASGLLTTYLDRLGTEQPADGSTSSSAPASDEAADTPQPDSNPLPARDGQRLDREQAEAIRAQLPPTVKPGTGQKTHGCWVDEQGQPQSVTSGQDNSAAAVWARLQALGIPLSGPPTATADVEQKVAIQMIQQGRQHVDVVINNEPCRGRFSCDTLVPIILPEGSSLTVHGTNGFRKTYTGGAKPPWSR